MQKIEVSVGAFTLDSSNGFLAKIVSTIAKNHKKTLTSSWTSLFKKKKNFIALYRVVLCSGSCED